MRELLTGTLVRVLLWTMLLLATVIIVNVIGIHVTGSIDRWQQWIENHTAVFFVWRLLLYAGTVYGWIWMHRRLLDREPGKGTQQRLRRMEVAAVLALATLEVSQRWQAG